MKGDGAGGGGGGGGGVGGSEKGGLLIGTKPSGHDVRVCGNILETSSRFEAYIAITPQPQLP